MTNVAAGSLRPLYATMNYAASLGLDVIDVPEWRTPVLIRPIPDSSSRDALGCYPLAVIAADADLHAGLQRLRAAGLVSIALVPDPLNGPSGHVFAEAFTVVREFKRHCLIDRELPIKFAKTHRQMVRRAHRNCEIRQVPLGSVLPAWIALYRGLVHRKYIRGIQNFTDSYFTTLAQVPELTTFIAIIATRIVAMSLWVRDRNIAYSHLAASSAEGYEAQAMYGLYATAFDHFADCHVLHLGGSAGATDDGNGGLMYFKQGFANRTVVAQFCGSVLDIERYAALTQGLSDVPYFPAYRAP